ncbi:MAG TPA: sugar-transfer associated ATP-grasp domain-containing protein, partial [Acidisphaera sp.]|nr:sugar-transfer associated ATP-grasp domain-containing protein [Acidisphaera sp.]
SASVRPTVSDEYAVGMEPPACTSCNCALLFVPDNSIMTRHCIRPSISLRSWHCDVATGYPPGFGRSRPIIHRAVAKIATGDNPADNFWRAGNMLGAIDLCSGVITRTVSGTGADITVNASHPDTQAPIVGTQIPDWDQATALVRVAAQALPGIRTQSWDVALTDSGPVLLEVNYGGDLNLAQLAHGAGVLDETYAEHLRQNGDRL